MAPDAPSPAPPDRWAVFSHRGFAVYVIVGLAARFSVQILTVAVGWQVYDLTRNPLDLGLIGLSQFAPALLLVFATGAAADRYRRRTIIALCLSVEGLIALALLVFSFSGSTDVRLVFALMVVFGATRSFFNPAFHSLAPNLVPKELLSQAIATNSGTMQIGTIVGPVTGGLLYGISAETAYGVTFALFTGAGILAMMIPRHGQRIVAGVATWETLSAGFRYIWNAKVVLGAVSLDLFAVLLGGATALLPVYARDILDVGPWGLGLLRAAPAIGAIAVAYYLANHPVRDHAGLIMFGFVALFGVATMVFGISTIVWVSILALAVLGAADMVSVYIRETLIQLWTPDELRGRVNAVNMVFIGASNELGEARAGFMAFLIGTVPAVFLGGLGTVVIAGLWMRLFPEIRKVRDLRDHL
jgi:MFS family permease